MKFYGTIKTNLMEYCQKQGVEDVGYSIDSLLFETLEGDTFSIDFEEGDYSIDLDSLSFRLKSLGLIFDESSESWERKYKGKDIENDADLFKLLTLKSIALYIPPHDNLFEEDLVKLEYKVIDCELHVGSEVINYDPMLVEVEI